MLRRLPRGSWAFTDYLSQDSYCPPAERASASCISGIVVHQESVCATFGSGLSSTCVVDVGDQKTSVCCVEDGVSHRNTRYGTWEEAFPACPSLSLFSSKVYQVEGLFW